MAGVIVGQGGHARDIAEWTGLPTIEHHRRMSADLGPFLLGMNDPAIRYRVAVELRMFRALRALAHPSAVVNWDGCLIAPGGIIGPLSSLTREVIAGRHFHVGAGVHLTRITVGECVTIGPGAVLCGDVTIGDRVLVGAGATVRNFVSIGSDAVIGAGAVVTKDVPPDAVMVGNPARRREVSL